MEFARNRRLWNLQHSLNFPKVVFWTSDSAYFRHSDRRLCNLQEAAETCRQKMKFTRHHKQWHLQKTSRHKMKIAENYICKPVNRENIIQILYIWVSEIHRVITDNNKHMTFVQFRADDFSNYQDNETLCLSYWPFRCSSTLIIDRDRSSGSGYLIFLLKRQQQI